MQWGFNAWVNGLCASPWLPNPIRPRLLRRAGVDVHEGAEIQPGMKVVKRPKVSIADRVFINANCVIDGFGELRIGYLSAAAVNVTFLTTTHKTGPPSMRFGELINKCTVVEEGVWIGASSTIFPGVTIGRGAIVGAGSVVRHDVPPNTVVAGVPARVVRELDPDEPRPAVHAFGPSHLPPGPIFGGGDDLEVS